MNCYIYNNEIYNNEIYNNQIYNNLELEKLSYYQKENVVETLLCVV
jgi:hypothetical protein